MAPALRTALEETGPIGSTALQLSVRTGTPTPQLLSDLEQLQDQGAVLRIGRGLWVLEEFRELKDDPRFAGPSEYVERFVREGGPALGAYRGPITFSSNVNTPIHRWWPYVQGYSAEFVSGLLSESALPRGSRVLDPFAGSGTTLVEARRAGFAAIGTELLAPAALAARVKTRFETSPSQLRGAAEALLRRAERAAPGEIPFLRETRRQFPPAVLRDLSRVRHALPPDGRPADEALRVAFGATIVPVSYLRRSPCLGYGPRRTGPTRGVREVFFSHIGRMAEDLRQLQEDRTTWGPTAKVWAQDARSLSLPSGSIDLAVTSPPYVNGMDYVMNYKLDLAWLGYVHSYGDLARLRQSSVACDNLPRAEAARYTRLDRLPDPWLGEIADGIRDRVAAKGSYRRDDAHGIVLRYFADLAPVLRAVRRALVPGGRFVLVVGDSLIAGTYVPGDLILARMGAALGLTLRSVDVARPRRSGQRHSFALRETIITLEKPRHG